MDTGNEDKNRHDGEDHHPDNLDSLLDGLLLDTKIVSYSRRKEGLKALLNKEIGTGDFETHLPQHLQMLMEVSKHIDERRVDIHRSYELSNLQINYRQELNTQQLAAVCTTDKPLLVIAGAGTGKTRVITYKVSYLIEKGYEPNEILLLTFTRKAANEMLSRVQKLLRAKSITNVLGGTFHAFANYALRKYHPLIDLPPNFTIIDGEDVTDIISLLKTELGLTPKKGSKHFPKSSTIQAIFSKAKNHELSIPEVIATYFPENERFVTDLERVHALLAAYKRRSNLMDYDDLIDTLRDKLKQHIHFKKALQEQISYILVDEYQDTNNIQREIVELLAQKGNITVVGDDAQSIYSFRGANFENILRFPQHFEQCGVVKIEENYRSSQRILDFTNDLIKNARIGFKKKLFSRLQKGRKPRVARLPGAAEEAEYIVDTIMALKENDLAYSDFAVLSRASWQSNFVQAELMKRNIPFVVVGGIKFGERRHVKDMISFLKIAMNPMDAVAWHRVLKLLEGIGDVRAKEIIGKIHQQNGRIDTSLFTGRKQNDDFKQLLDLFDKIQQLDPVPADLIPPIYEFYKPVLQRIEDDFEARTVDLDIFAEIAAKYEDLEKFLADFTLEPPSNRYQDKNIPFNESDEKPLTISTIHSAKGLEWHTVFVPFALDGILPSVRSMASLEEVEEERRLFYVACSRAKENLFISMPAYVSSWDAVFTKPSRFLNEVSDGLYEIVEG
ncbi:ATP-dependent helicase [Olivibacter sp. XZL3]|uniref:ATP-dependent helicase n=1 Tax=Olivibacter sp. XZL3 TaxID=1735116 RepID=UPI001064C1BF|nr:ATP-dependent helicase [Olivibacter sp. XZL3]